MTSGGTTWTNTYNSDGLRTSRTDGTTTYTYYYEGGRLSAIKRNDLNMWIIYDENGPVTLKYGVGTFHYVTNPQGDVVAIVGANGQKLVEYTYDAWGKVTSITGDYAYNLGVHNPILYRGYIYDHETGLYYCQSRYYDPEIGRWLNADALVATGQGMLGNNMFAYCNNNPVMYSDPSGHMLAYDMFKKAIVGDGSDQYYDEKSKLSRALAKSTNLQEEFSKNLERFIASGAIESGTYFGYVDTYEGESLTDKDLSLSVGLARYSMTITRETRTIGILWWKKEQTRYVTTIRVSDKYDFTEFRTDISFGSIMNNAAYIGQIGGIVVPYNWEATTVITTEWEDV